jgi:ribosomal protein L11 methyltransferase
MKNNYYEVSIIFNKQNYDALYNQLYYEGIENILEENGMLKIYFEEDELKKLNLIKESLIEEKIIKAKDFTFEKLKNKNWNDEWEKTIEPVFIRDKIIIYPSWKKNELNDTEGKILIELDPKMSFGTGHNETTQLVLELMCDYIRGNESRLLDYGTGTGILSIAGVKMGIEEVIAIDIDEDSIANAKEYFKKNSVHKKIKLFKSGISELEEYSFDIICANIIRSVITDNFEHINDKLKVNGKLFLSGILNTEDQIILELLFQNDFDVEDIISKSEWIGIYAIKR